MAEKREIDLRRFTRGIKKYIWVYIISLILFISLGITYWIIGMPVYKTYSAMLIEDSSNSGSMRGGSGMMAMMRTFSIGGFGSSSANNEILLINSHDVLLRTVKDLGLNRTYIRKNGLKKELLFKNTPILLEAPEQMMDTMENGCSIEVDIKGNKADITVTQGRFKKIYSRQNNTSLPASVKTPSGNVQILRTDHFTGEPEKIIIGLTSFNGAVATLAEDIKVTSSSKLSEGLSFKYSSPNKERNEAILNTLMGVYNDKRLRRKHETANQEIKFLDERINSLFSDLTQTQEQMAEYKEKYNLMGIEEQAQVLAESAIENQTEIVKVQAQILYYEELLHSLRNPSNQDTLLPVFDSEGYPMIKDYNELLLKKKELERSAKESNIALATINNQIAEMRASVIDNISGLLQAARIADRAQSDLINSATGRLRSLPRYEKEYINLYRDQKLQNELYVFLLEKRESAVLQLYSQNTLGFIIDEAYTSVKPDKTKKIVIFCICLFLGLLCPTCFVVWRMRNANNKVYEPMDLAFIGVEDHTVVFSDTDSSAPNRLRTLINENGIKSLYVSSYEGSGTDFARLTDSFRNMGWNVGMLKPSDIGLANSNDSLISPAFQDYIGTSKKDYNILFIPVPDSRHTYELVSDINTKGSGVLLNIRSGSISRPQLRTSLSGIDSSHVFAMIDRN